MFLRKPQHKRFEYLPRYYDPSRDESARDRRRIKFERTVRRGNHRPFIVIVAMFILAYILYTILR
ncbi:MAG: hypothetical protein M5R41_02400 [Bacteroidia bacterium]|nr:hypothetical protein [Bacteroidia bacterium]